MENQSTFNLLPAIQSWRSALIAEPAIREDDADELEAHLRDTMKSLEAASLNSEEAFLIATRRLGHPAALGEQFGQANPLRLWKQRALWMLLGIVSLWAVTKLANFAALLSFLIGVRWTDNGAWLGFSGLAVQALTIAAVGLWVWREVHPSNKARILPRMAIGKLFAGLFIAIIALFLGEILLNLWVARKLTPTQLGGYYVVVRGISAPLLLFVVAGAVGLLVWPIRRQHIWTCAILCGSLLILGCKPKTTSNPGAPSGASSSAPTGLDSVLEIAKSDPAKSADDFLKLDLSTGPLFAKGTPLSFSEADFMKLPSAANEKIGVQAEKDVKAIKELVREIKKKREQARAGGQTAVADQCTAQLRKLAEHLQGPQNLALTQKVGKSIEKLAAE